MPEIKNIKDMTDDEIREAYVQVLARRAKNKWTGHSKRRELIEADPKAYFTRRQDFERAERKDSDSTKNVPKLNVNG